MHNRRSSWRFTLRRGLDTSTQPAVIVSRHGRSWSRTFVSSPRLSRRAEAGKAPLRISKRAWAGGTNQLETRRRKLSEYDCDGSGWVYLTMTMPFISG